MISRRTALHLGGSGLVVGLAGCLTDSDADDASSDEPTADEQGETETDGDSEDSPGSDGLLYAFSPNRIDIIDPELGEIVDDITDEINGLEWGDPRITHDHSQIFITEQTRAQLLVIDTERRAIEGWVDVGPDPMHIYAPLEGEIWAHSDAEGQFYVVDTDSLEVVDTVESAEEGGHGKLLVHDELTATDVAYAGNVNESSVWPIDLETRERLDPIDVGEGGGTHYKAYAPETGYAFFERSGLGVTAVVDTERGEQIDELPFAGGMYLSPDETLLAVLDGEEIQFLDVTDEAYPVVDTMRFEGELTALRYYDGEDNQYAFGPIRDTDDVVILDFEEREPIDWLDVGEAESATRSAIADDRLFVTAAAADGTVTIVNMSALGVSTVDVGSGVDTLQLVSDSGVGYRGT